MLLSSVVPAVRWAREVSTLIDSIASHFIKRYIRIELSANWSPAMDITKDISPLTEFKRDSSRMIARIKET